MTPTEFDLRAALRDGEGDGPDPESIVAAGRARRSARRGRIVAVSGVVAGVLALGGTGGVLLAQHGTDHQAADSAAGGTSGEQKAAGAAGAADRAGSAPGLAPPPVGVAPTTSPVATSLAAGSLAGSPAACPPDFAPVQAAAPGGTSRLADQTLLPAGVTSVLVCGYGTTADGPGARPGSITLTGSDASRLASSLDSAPRTRPARMCPDFRNADDHRLALVGITSGTHTAPVYTTLTTNPCIQQATNGTAIRYDWSPPADLLARLLAVSPR